MVASIPNDIFQFSTFAALHEGFNEGQPRTADLTTHGTHGIGVYENGSLMILNSGQAYEITKDGKADFAPEEARLPFAMVTIFQPTFRAKIPSFSIETLEAFVSSSEYGPVRSTNTLLPFKVTGVFRTVEFEHGSKYDLPGTIFGFVVPSWMKHISGPRVHAYFIDANEVSGGRVVDVQMDEEATLSFAKCGRFHLGFPQGEAWEDVRLS